MCTRPFLPGSPASNPVSRIEIAGQLSPPLALPGSASLRIKELEEGAHALRRSAICAFNQLLDLKDLNIGVHSTRLAEWGLRVGQELGLDEAMLQNLEVAALLHDIGKIRIPDAILRKPAKLDNEEYALMKRHPEYGWLVLREVSPRRRVVLGL